MALRRGDGGVLLDIRLTPNAAHNRVEGVIIDGEGRPRLKIKVTAIPENGKANSALVKLMSKSTKRGKGDFEIISGKLDRNKTLLIKGDPVPVEAEIRKWLESK
ncbi:MAG: YggU family protein [Sneathiella sp.]|uniref:DUF167 family protein n=1 Tax=Sneathiella sp. TaxID=1964365 RepID=UPI000C5EF1F6|nr:DUF167 family protein [Sneathiella sp.]MAZ04674.1 YggU family protein [Sneathiella sp.]|tara:strand:- start:163 stop:474 length:312 start_codon:yes stop_codon:yes gene_type:complete